MCRIILSKRRLAITLTVVVMLTLSTLPGLFTSQGSVHAEDGAEGGESPELTDISAGVKQNGYDRYAAKYESAAKPSQSIKVEAESYSRVEGMSAEILDQYEGSEGQSVMTAETGTIEWKVDIPEEGMYQIGIRYYPVEGKSSSIERELNVDGRLPFEEAATLMFPRVWANEKKEIERDNRGNDLRPRQSEAPIWQETAFRDMEGYYEKPYYFYFAEGSHTISLRSTREPMVIDYLILHQEDSVPKYSDLKKEYAEKGYKPVQNEMIKVQGEAAVMKSSPTLYPISDRASPKTEPSHISKIRINTIGGYNWRMPGQWIVWSLDVPEDGLYKIGIKNRQNLLRGLYSTRKLMIDGKVPFQEMEKIDFTYSGNWQMKLLGDDDEPYLFYLSKGKHELKLEVTLGDLAPLLRKVENSVLQLNYMYRKILMLTGTVPDPYRDYQLDKQIPDMMDVFKKESGNLYAISAALEKVTGGRSDQAAILNTLAYQLADMAKRPETVPKRLDQYKINVGGLGTWILTVREQPLEIDYLLAASPEQKLPKPEASFIGKVFHEVGAFFYSFIEDYTSIGNVSDKGKSVTVWIGTGRDQAQVLKAMIDDTFTAQTGINVNLKLVNMGVLLPAALAKQGPDVAMQIGNDIPVNYAMRNAAVDLTQFKDYPEVAERFRKSAIVPYEYQHGIYALPEQQTFSMLFYRKDILDELGLKVPDTWEDVYNMIPVLQKHHMEFALPLEQNQTGIVNLVPNQAFSMFLYQEDGQFYKNGGTASDLDSEVAMKAFKRWAEFYTNYKFPLKFDFPNRFRTGEMPIGIADYTFYNHLSVSAPEIRGLWDFVPVPGTPQMDGTVRRDVASSGTAAIMLKAAKDKDASWQFMKWWTDKETQARFGREMEGLMGAAARYPTANIEALKELPWPVKDYNSLSQEWEWVRGVPEVPGGYFTGRHLDNAFRKVVNEGTNTRETLYDYVRYINEEITLKRKEFELSE